MLYVGITNNLAKRTYEHKNGTTGGFTSKYNLKTLVYFEILDNSENAIHREKRLKKYTREAKIKLIEENNSEWNDLYNQITGQNSQDPLRITA